MKSQFLTNYTEITFLDKIRDNLRHCKAFDLSVSFIKKAGLVLLWKDIEAAVQRGAKGRIITSTYQNFTDIESLKSFLMLQSSYGNFECHLDHECFHDNGYMTLGYHSKGYLFDFGDREELIVGSSNLTRYALLKNIEWDVVVSLDNDTTEEHIETFAAARDEFEEKWNQTHPLNSEIISLYTNKLNFAIERWDMDYDLSSANIKPNFMQRKALKELNRYRSVGTSRALVVAAAGSGKTYLAAFDALNFNPKRLLYVVHEGSILKKSMETFADVFGNNVTYGLFNGESKEMDADFVFATNITMAKSKELFAKDTFDYIIIDECHHAAAQTYKDIMGYFEPEFLLGLTATPERMDNQDVFEMFDKNVPYELRLRDAIINDLVVPFHYYGIRDQLVDYGLTSAEERKLVAQLCTQEHADFVSKEIESHRPEGKLKVLAFCRNVNHARQMAEVMGERYRTAYLTGRNDVGERIRAYNDLQKDEGGIEILFTVDILNEGVDIPGVNMVLFMRPTESSTIFIQQLGRGLRKYDNKPYVTVLDFIGNSYKRSVQIAFALSSLSENFVLEKRLMKSLVEDDFKAVGLDEYGVEIHIDALSKEEIKDFLDKENFNAIKYLKQDYFNFKKYIGAEQYPSHMDYWNCDVAPDLLRFMSIKIGAKKTNSYYNFLRGVAPEEDQRFLPMFDDRQVDFIGYLSEMLPLVRPHEYMIFQTLLKGENSLNAIHKALEDNIPDFTEEQWTHTIKYMIKNGFVQVDTLSSDQETISLTVKLDKELKEYLDDLLTYGLTRYSVEYAEGNFFNLWKSYRIDQVQLKWLKDPGSIFKGTYVYDGNVIIFASIKKDASIQEHLMYKDRFLQSNMFQWECEAGLNEKNQNELIDSKKAYLFIRKVKDENGITMPFTYVGEGKMTNPRKTDNPKGSLLFDIEMDNELPEYLQYDFGVK